MIHYKGNSYPRIQKFDCITLSLGYTNGPGGFLTCFPISPKEYREKNPTKASVSILVSKTSTEFVITSDWGQDYNVTIDNEHSTEITSAVQSAKKEGLISASDYHGFFDVKT